MTYIEQNILDSPNIYKYLEENIDMTIEIFSNQELWTVLYHKIYNEYKDDTKYIECTNKYKNYHYTSMCNDYKYKIFFKLTKYENISKGFEYKPGLNVDTNEFNPTGCCSGGGLYFCNLENLHQFTGFGNYLTPIIIPKNTPVYQEIHSRTCNCEILNHIKFKAPCVYTLPRFRIDNHKINNFLSKSSSNNIIFKYFTFYNSINLNELMFFKKETFFMDFWNNEYCLSIQKINILQNNYISMTNICELKKKDKFILDWLINTGFPKQLQQKSFNPIKNLNLNSEKYLKCYFDKEIKLFSKFRVVVAGSNILRYITDKTFRPNDIDLYINDNEFNEFIKTNDFIINKSNENKYSKYNMKNIVKIVEIKTKCEISDQYGYSKQVWKKYQLIVVDIEPIQFIKLNFDFDLCAIGFDFATKSFVNTIDKPDYSVLSIQPTYINKMCGEETDSYSNYRANKTINRMVKYINRGFYITPFSLKFRTIIQVI